MGRRDGLQEELFVACFLRELIPEDHILRRVKRVLDLSWLREEVRELYDGTNGRPGMDPQAAVRLMPAGSTEQTAIDQMGAVLVGVYNS